MASNQPTSTIVGQYLTLAYAGHRPDTRDFLFFTIASEDWFTIVNYTMIAAIAALALNVLSGYTGQISLGLAFFMAIGAYTAALLGGPQPTSSLDPQGFGLSVLIWLPAAGIAAHW